MYIYIYIYNVWQGEGLGYSTCYDKCATCVMGGFKKKSLN